MQQALELHSILSQSDTNLRQPVDLEEQLLTGRMGSDVGQSMLQMLQVTYLLHQLCCVWKRCCRHCHQQSLIVISMTIRIVSIFITIMLLGFIVALHPSLIGCEATICLHSSHQQRSMLQLMLLWVDCSLTEMMDHHKSRKRSTDLQGLMLWQSNA